MGKARILTRRGRGPHVAFVQWAVWVKRSSNSLKLSRDNPARLFSAVVGGVHPSSLLIRFRSVFNLLVTIPQSVGTVVAVLDVVLHPGVHVLQLALVVLRVFAQRPLARVVVLTQRRGRRLRVRMFPARCAGQVGRYSPVEVAGHVVGLTASFHQHFPMPLASHRLQLTAVIITLAF